MCIKTTFLCKNYTNFEAKSKLSTITGEFSQHIHKKAKATHFCMGAEVSDPHAWGKFLPFVPIQIPEVHFLYALGII